MDGFWGFCLFVVIMLYVLFGVDLFFDGVWGVVGVV